MTELITQLATPQIKWIITLISIDVILGIIAALVKRDFRLGKLAGFMEKGIIGYVFGFAILGLVEQALPQLGIVVSVAFALIVLALIGSILSNLSKIGLPLANWLKKE